MKNIFHALMTSLEYIIIFIISLEMINSNMKNNIVAKDYEEITSEIITYEYKAEKIKMPMLMSDYLEEESEIEPETECLIEEQKVADEDILLIAWITMGEAEGECEEGKRLVIDTILNRVDNNSFPNTIYDVIYQPSQFSCVWNGRLNRTESTEEVCALVREELANRCNYDVLYFTAGGYGKYGKHLFKVGNHYFCGE